MIKEAKFVLSRKQYAVEINSLRVTAEHKRSDGSSFWKCVADAVWYRRKHGYTHAAIGTLWDYQDEKPSNIQEFLERLSTGRHGGSAVGRLYLDEDGREHYWGEQDLEVMNEHLAILRPMLIDFPSLPTAAHDGWWRF